MLDYLKSLKNLQENIYQVLISLGYLHVSQASIALPNVLNFCVVGEESRAAKYAPLSGASR